jgi:hypothetical protein
MSAMMQLRDAAIYPTDEVLMDVLGDAFKVYSLFIKTITIDPLSLSVEWRYYNDGKAWLAKVQFKKKTILWLSVWDVFFKITFYFTEKHIEAIAGLNISEAIKVEFCKAKPVGRLIPLILEVRIMDQMDDLLTLVRFKKSLK